MHLRPAVTIAAVAVVALAAPVDAAPPPPPSPPSSTTTTTTVPPPTTTTVPAIPAEQWTRFDDSLQRQLLGRGNRAVGVAVAVGGEVVHVGAFGSRTPETDALVITDDRFRIASISKVVTATVVMQLVAEDLVGLDEPVGDRLALLAGVAHVDPAVPSITVRQLLSHTSGFPKYRREFFNGSFDSCPAAAAHGMSRPLADRPGTRHTYSNLNYCLLTLLVAHLTDTSYEEAVSARLLEPLGISGMRLAGTHDAGPGEVVHVSGEGRTYMEALGGAGAWVASAEDLVRILDSLDPETPGWRPLPPHLATLMHAPLAGVAYPEPQKRTYGLGIVVWPGGSWGHTGTVENTRAMAARRADGVTWCILVSGSRPDQTERLADVFDRSLRDAAITFAR